MSNVFTKEDTFLDLHDWNCLWTWRTFLRTRPLICGKNTSRDDNDSSTSQIVHTDNISWDCTPSRKHDATVTNEDKGCMHEHIGSNKYRIFLGVCK